MVSAWYLNFLQCLEKPLEPQYGGGMVVTPVPKQSEGLKGWMQVGNAAQKIDSILAMKFGDQESPTLKFQLEVDKLYAFSGTYVL